MALSFLPPRRRYLNTRRVAATLAPRSVLCRDKISRIGVLSVVLIIYAGVSMGLIVWNQKGARAPSTRVTDDFQSVELPSSEVPRTQYDPRSHLRNATLTNPTDDQEVQGATDGESTDAVLKSPPEEKPDRPESDGVPGWAEVRVDPRSDAAGKEPEFITRMRERKSDHQVGKQVHSSLFLYLVSSCDFLP